MNPEEDEKSIEELRDEAFWDDDGAMVFEEEDMDDYNDRAVGREY